MDSSVMFMMEEEVTCPICLELLNEPVSADCDHSFCRACITLNYESSKSKEGEGVCPVCRVSYLFGNLRPNRHVANIVERLKGLKSNLKKQQKVNVCAQHGEKLQLFCEKDMVAICWLCERSQEHRGHVTALIEEVAYKYENQIQGDVEKVQMEFKGLREFLDSKEKNEVQKLKQEEEDIMNSLAESESELVKQRESVRALISDLEHQLQCSTMEMLQGVNSVLKRSQTLRLKQPEMIPRKQRRIFRAPDLKGMLQVFQGENSYILWVTIDINVLILLLPFHDVNFHPFRAHGSTPFLLYFRVFFFSINPHVSCYFSPYTSSNLPLLNYKQGSSKFPLTVSLDFCSLYH
uniref:Tripartite motif-containing protein 5-like n=1 Tax=Peromyscus maniculatus bairdii TaxID=230844 RepID=A0A8C8T8A2_PERMB